MEGPGSPLRYGRDDGWALVHRRSSPRPPPRRESPPRERVEDEPRDERVVADRLLRDGSDFDERLGAEARDRDVEREGVDSRPLERLRLGADWRLGPAEERDRLAPRLCEREGAEERSRPELERTVNPRGTEMDERSRSERPARLLDERESRSAACERLVDDADCEDRNDSVMRSALVPDDRETEAFRPRDSARAGARPVTVRRLLSREEERSLRRAWRPLSPRLRPAARASSLPSRLLSRLEGRDSLRLLLRSSATRCDRIEPRSLERASRSNELLERRCAAQSRRSERATARELDAEFARTEALRALSTRRLFATRPR